MTTWSSKLLVLVFVPMVTGSISFISSLTIITMIFRSDLKLGTVYRRLVFGTSAFDLIQSLSQAIGTITMPKGSMYAAVGNDVTCDLQGFATVLGTSGSTFYSLSLSVYFISVVKFGIAEREITKFAESFLHILPVALAFSGGIYLYVAGYFNASGSTFCWIAPQPYLDCIEDNPVQECREKWKHLILRAKAITSYPRVFVMVLNCLALVILLWVDRTQARRSRRYRRAQQYYEQQSQENVTVQNDVSATVTVSPNSGLPATHLTTRPPYTSVQRRGITMRAIAYIMGFTLTYIFSFIFRLLQLRSDVRPPFILELLTRFFFPLGGFFNLIVFSYPLVVSYRRLSEGSTWIQAFLKVIKSGGDIRSNRARIRGDRVVTEVANSLSGVSSAVQMQLYTEEAT